MPVRYSRTSLEHPLKGFCREGSNRSKEVVLTVHLEMFKVFSSPMCDDITRSTLS